MDFDGVRQSFEVNAMGPLRCVQALLPNLKKGSKVGTGGSNLLAATGLRGESKEDWAATPVDAWR
jgi:NAD(P)-dependent dehydrogenase (short-subunit alcohol dehydrogenase family)